ncbi:unnamed protein product [Pleuronectes platessa]|uniref:Uncharacterized protein n=1 Tax=Pleuronectes platessa TaxID=8262 RepID=A0A9N7YV33_PLEPL|nr:unnamed protein product [Pleuronectes platessa]
MDFRPVFRCLPSTNTLILKASAAALTVAQCKRRATKAFILQAEGDPSAASSSLASTGEREAGDTSQSPLAVNKDALASYARLFPQMVQLIQWRRMRKGFVSLRGMDRTLVGFGAHAGLSLRALYLRWLKTQHINMGLLIYTVQVYILGRDKEGLAAGPSAAAPPPAAPPAQRRASPPTSRAASAAEIKELSDNEELFAAAMEVDKHRSCRLSQTLVISSDVAHLGDHFLRGLQTGLWSLIHCVYLHMEMWRLDPPGLDPSLTRPQLLPKGWRQTLPEEQHEWLGRALFTAGTGKHPVLTSELSF